MQTDAKGAMCASVCQGFVEILDISSDSALPQPVHTRAGSGHKTSVLLCSPITTVSISNWLHSQLRINIRSVATPSSTMVISTLGHTQTLDADSSGIVASFLQAWKRGQPHGPVSSCCLVPRAFCHVPRAFCHTVYDHTECILSSDQNWIVWDSVPQPFIQPQSPCLTLILSRNPTPELFISYTPNLISHTMDLLQQ